MKKFLLFATSLCLAASAMAAEQGAGTIKQTTIKYNVPTCENCKTTTYEETYRSGKPRPPMARPAPCATCAAEKPCAKSEDGTCANKNLGIANPLFFVKPGQVSSETIGSVWKAPKGAEKNAAGEKSGESRGYDVAERIYYGLYDRLALHLEGGYAFQAPKTKQYKAWMGAPVPHYSSYNGTVGLNYHLIDKCPLDLIVGLDGTWGRAVYKQGDIKDGVNYTRITPNARLGVHVGYVTPYLVASYSFAHSHDKGLAEDFYHIAPGVYIQPSKYFAFDVNAEKIEHEKWQYNAGIDVYPYKNMAVGIQLHAVKPFDHPMYTYGAGAHVKFVF
ncbi:MAG: hypothetical protein J6Y85_05185 [Alphaproteobacteria bacterium]|nr:hypothetical protein [Alphaproteobacteria bacterium]